MGQVAKTPKRQSSIEAFYSLYYGIMYSTVYIMNKRARGALNRYLKTMKRSSNNENEDHDTVQKTGDFVFLRCVHFSCRTLLWKFTEQTDVPTKRLNPMENELSLSFKVYRRVNRVRLRLVMCTCQ